MGLCRLCGRRGIVVSDTIGFCVDCIRNRFDEVYPYLRDLHRRLRLKQDLTPETPKNGVYKCSVCGRGCLLENGVKGYCSLRYLHEGKLYPITGHEDKAVGLYYYDPHPTNCVAYPVCPAVTGRGYPRYSLTQRGERGYYNLAVFLGGCNMDCLYCQNWEYRLMCSKSEPLLSIDELVDALNDKTTCVCFFGGDPGPWSTFVLRVVEKMVSRSLDNGLKPLRICWETNGLWNPILFRKAVMFSLKSGGIVKIDFKAWSPEVYYALTGIDMDLVHIIRENMKIVAERFDERRDPPLLVVSTLLVPGYVDEHEIRHITRFVAELNPDIPMVFLAFHPDYVLRDLPPTSFKHAEKAVEIARENGLKNVFIGNEWLLGNYY